VSGAPHIVTWTKQTWIKHQCTEKSAPRWDITYLFPDDNILLHSLCHLSQILEKIEIVWREKVAVGILYIESDGVQQEIEFLETNIKGIASRD